MPPLQRIRGGLPRRGHPLLREILCRRGGGRRGQDCRSEQHPDEVEPRPRQQTEQSDAEAEAENHERGRSERGTGQRPKVILILFCT